MNNRCITVEYSVNQRLLVCRAVCVEEYFVLSTSVYSVRSQLCLLCLFSVMVIIYLSSAPPYLAILHLNPRIQQF